MSAKNEKSKRYHQGRWAPNEHQRFLNALEKYGKNWVQVQKKVKTRSVGQVRSHAQKIFMNMTEKDVEDLFLPDISEEQTFAHQDSKGGVRNGQMENEEISSEKHYQEENYSVLHQIDEPNLKQIGFPLLSSQNIHDHSKSKGKKGVSEEALPQEGDLMTYNSLFMEILYRHKKHFLEGGNFLSLLKL